MNYLRVPPADMGRPIWSACLGISLSLGVVSPSVYSQESEKEIFELSPFQVSADEDVGYRSTSTLAGTRLKTELGDLPNSITVATKELMDDLNVTDATNLLPYLGNIETSGPDGTFSGGNTAGSVQLEGRNRNPENNNRIRGLANADSTRNYMPTSIGFDSYNVDRVTVNRGPNSTLFGLGAPGGIIDNTTISANFATRNKVEITWASFDSYRFNFDVERELVEGKLGIRVAGLTDRKHWRQSFSYENDDRLTIAALYRPFEKANLRLSYEAGEVDARRPRINAPRDGGITRWWDPAFNQITHNPFEDEFGTIDRDLVRAPGDWFGNPAVVYETDGQEGSRLNFAWENTVRDGSRFRAYTVGLTRGDQWFPSATAADAGIEFGSFYGNNEVIDRSIFDWVEKRLDGPNAREWEDFDVINASYDQSWDYSLGSYGFELSYMKEGMERSWFDLLGGDRGYYITMDINETLNWGEPNPNFGRPYVASNNQRQQNNIDRNVVRGTAFYELNLKNTDGNVWKWFGRHTGTLFGQEYEIDRGTINGRNLVDPAYLAASQNGEQRLTTGGAQARTQFYVGPSLANADSAVGANLPGITSVLRTDTTTGWFFDENAGGDGAWTTMPVTIGDVRDDATFYNQIHGQSLNRQVTESKAYVHQVYFFDKEWLVGTWGRRTDKVTTYGGVATRDATTNLFDLASRQLETVPNDTPFEETTESLGAVLHVPDMIPLPDGVDLSFHWGESENFQISAPRINLFGNLIPPPQGKTTDEGFSIGLFENKLYLKFNWYESESGNVTFGYPGFLFETDRRIIRYNTQADRDAAGYQGPPDFYKQLTGWEIIEGASTDSGQSVQQSGTDFALTDTQSTTSRGKEIDVIYNPMSNWRISLNISQQEAVSSNIAPATVEYLTYRIDEWTNPNNPASFLIADESDQPVNIRVFDTLLNGLNSSLAREGQLVGELREWRWNLATNYRFEDDSVFKGWNIGGAFRWEDKKAVGYPITLQTLDGQTLPLPDLANPYTDDAVERLDLWVGYKKKIMDGNVDWKLQLNLANALSDGEIITTVVQTDGTPRSVTWREGRTFRLRSTFEF
ncbi:TonB-dependent receptor plug domain-containing protein [Pelagicoccus sp. SDUM812005]|uniref:TonB-dependent receptor plug domain-containing protein n=1 Tax=Pelagicoccus sp. SDUM812005 TaxID=3041257 RepID=UPI00280CB9D4|nr:TonB-dependent receptor plug domain-containing protein [Pelagicoccus sp. SDUM812005]MDQ8181613.1 TonB-dependent receptor plug domain-containing protein [Pelagicoccus sp. SDUM812005]